MKKIEIIWRELLFQAIEKKNRQFTQRELAEKFDFSTSTIFQALKVPRRMGAVRVTGRFFLLEDPEKLLFHWASVRNLKRDTIFSGRTNLAVLKIEGMIPPDLVLGGFTAAKQVITPPADYDKVYVYTKFLPEFSPSSAKKVKNSARDDKLEILEKLRERFEFIKGSPNLFVLRGDEFLDSYGEMTTLAQTFVDLWNLSDWYAKEFVRGLKEKIDEFLP